MYGVPCPAMLGMMTKLSNSSLPCASLVLPGSARRVTTDHPISAIRTYHLTHVENEGNREAIEWRRLYREIPWSLSLAVLYTCRGNGMTAR